ncbi:PREDICTED: G-protein coupled receptor 35-like [Leptosomus discolor]|uniref:G-protein coupled receptor 35-like n=1 Tax=Leptosomus discolor TaxID=188344 RepID=UPI000522DF12|nr:PREDICTED: G-protein coupled receptor 35-like [Leptosomus discolor]
MENCTEDDDTQQNGTVLFQLIVYIPVLSLGIPLNMIAFWVFCFKLKRWTETRVYMINLVVADSFLLFALPFLIYFTTYNHPIDNLCFTILNIYFTNMPMSILIITLIAIDRYIAIKAIAGSSVNRGWYEPHQWRQRKLSLQDMLRRGRGASSTNVAAVTATGKWSSQDTLLVACQDNH